jgi:Mn-dependent DtxR family transcriptional regulator
MSKPKDVTQKTFQPHLLLVMAEMTEWTPGAEIKGEDTFKPVCERMGITEEEWGTPKNHSSLWTHRLIGFAMKNMRDHGWSEYLDRGVWTLTEEGVKAAMGSSSEDNVGEEGHEVEQEVLEAALAKSAMDMASDLDEDLDNLVELEVKKPSHPYSDDPYIRSLAIAQTGCFGAFAKKSPICKECPLQAECVGALHQSKSALAEKLGAKEAAERRKREAEEVEARRRDESVDELMNLLGDDPPPKDDPDTSLRTPGVVGKATIPSGKKAVKSTSQRAALCHHCQGQLPKDSENWWIKGVGVFHLDCLEVPAK